MIIQYPSMSTRLVRHILPSLLQSESGMQLDSPADSHKLNISPERNSGPRVCSTFSPGCARIRVSIFRNFVELRCFGVRRCDLLHILAPQNFGICVARYACKTGMSSDVLFSNGSVVWENSFNFDWLLIFFVSFKIMLFWISL